MVRVHTGPEGSLSAGRKQGDKPVVSREGLKGAPVRIPGSKPQAQHCRCCWSLKFSEVNFGALVLTQSSLALGSVDDKDLFG